MSAQLDRLAANTALLKGLQLATLSSLGILTGVASALYVWAIPIIQEAPDARTKIAQFSTVISKGFAYLQPLSRILVGCLAALTALFYRNPDPAIASRWKYYALALSVLAPSAPYEVYAIFPTNDELKAKGEQFDQDKDGEAGEGRDEEVDELLRKWQWRHVGRIVAPGAALLVGLWSVIAEQKF